MSATKGAAWFVSIVRWSREVPKYRHQSTHSVGREILYNWMEGMRLAGVRIFLHNTAHHQALGSTPK